MFTFPRTRLSLVKLCLCSLTYISVNANLKCQLCISENCYSLYCCSKQCLSFHNPLHKIFPWLRKYRIIEANVEDFWYPNAEEHNSWGHVQYYAVLCIMLFSNKTKLIGALLGDSKNCMPVGQTVFINYVCLVNIWTVFLIVDSKLKPEKIWKNWVIMVLIFENGLFLSLHTPKSTDVIRRLPRYFHSNWKCSE